MADMQFTKLLIDTAAHQIPEQYSENPNVAIRKKFAEVLGIAEDEHNAVVIKKAFRKNKSAVYELIEVTIEDRLVSGWGDNPFFRELVEERNLLLGQKNEFYVPDDSILTVSKFAGDHHDLVRQKLGMGKMFSVTMNTYGLKVYEEFARFQAGIIDWANFIDKIYEAADKHVNDMLYKSFTDLEKFAPAGNVFNGSLTADKVLEIAENVEIGSGHPVMICGSRKALSKLQNLVNAGWVSNEMKEQRNTSGYLAKFEGIDTVVIPQTFKQGTRERAYADDKLYILPKTDNKPIKLVWEGDAQFNESVDPTARMDATVEAEYTYTMGVATVVGLDYGVITIGA